MVIKAVYSHLIKGATIGSALMRKLGRPIIGLVGLVLDALFVAPGRFFCGGFIDGDYDYLDYWNASRNASFVATYPDNSEYVGLCRTSFVFVGDIIGYLVGGLIGGVLGGILYIPDMILCVLCEAHNKIREKLAAFATLVGSGDSAFFEELYFVIKDPEHSISRTCNIFAATLGLLIIALPYALTKIVEALCPSIGNELSQLFKQVGALVGACVGFIVGVCLFVPQRLSQEAVDLYYGVRGVGGFRDFVRSVTAFMYVVTSSSCETGAFAHSKEFISRVKEYRQKRKQKKSWFKILFGEKTVPPLTTTAQTTIALNKENPSPGNGDNSSSTPPPNTDHLYMNRVPGSESSAQYYPTSSAPQPGSESSNSIPQTSVPFTGHTLTGNR